MSDFNKPRGPTEPRRRPGRYAPDPDRQHLLDARRDADDAKHKEAIKGREGEEEVPPDSVGYEETLPGQEEIVAGTVEHQQELTTYPNATSYAGDVNVVLPPEEEEDGEGGAEGAPTNVDVPHVQQNGAVLNCTMGNWEGEPTSYAYKWQMDGQDVAGESAADLSVDADDVGKTATCIVTATNAAGSTAAPPSNGVVVEAGMQRDEGMR